MSTTLDGRNDHQNGGTSQPSRYATNIAKSMTIDEMRELHNRALTEAEAKETELRLVLASRYRELVGSSDEVLDMQRHARELEELVQAVPNLVSALVNCSESGGAEDSLAEEKTSEPEKECEREDFVMEARFELANAPSQIHSCLDDNNVHGAATSLIQIFTLITTFTKDYQLANVLAQNGSEDIHKKVFSPMDPALYAQMKMVFLHLQTLPDRTIRHSKKILLQSSSQDEGTRITASALSALNLLNVDKDQSNDVVCAGKLLDLYFDSKAKLILSLLRNLSVPSDKEASSGSTSGNGTYSAEAADAAETIISKIIRILQYDIILHPYHIFILRRYGSEPSTKERDIMGGLPEFDATILKTKTSNFLAAHLPLIRTKVKNVLVAIAGTTASRLGHMRQSLYDNTDGEECRKELDSNDLCTWDTAVSRVVDVKLITHALEGITTSTTSFVSTSGVTGSSTTHKRFSLWGTLFSNTFSSLVHSLLTTSFHSVHARVVATLRASIANAPPFESILPHEAYRNTLRIASELDTALKTVSDDAHELLVHAEEREESERRLRQSLYVQTCEVMGRLLNELRRMLIVKHESKEEKATKEFIVGRLCFLLKFRLTSLPTLLDPASSPAALTARSGGKVGMITLAELQSAFEIADDNDSGFISFEEAADAVEGAFSGTHFHGAEMVRETMLLVSSGMKTKTGITSSKAIGTAPENLTLSELALLSARGLRHSNEGPESAIGTIQRSLDDTVQRCFSKWACVVLSPHLNILQSNLKTLLDTASTVNKEEWERIFHHGSRDLDHNLQKEIGSMLSEDEDDESKDTQIVVPNISPHITSFFLSTATVLTQSICPADSLPPCPSAGNVSSMGNKGTQDSRMIHVIRSSLLKESLTALTDVLEKSILPSNENELLMDSDDIKLINYNRSSLIQLYLDLGFVSLCYFKRNKFGFDPEPSCGLYYDDQKPDAVEPVLFSERKLGNMEEKIVSLMREKGLENMKNVRDDIENRYNSALSICDLFFSPLFGTNHLSTTSTTMVTEQSSPPLLISPLISSRRFTLLPIQAEQSVNELQQLRNMGNDKTDRADSGHMNSASSAASAAMSSGFGFLSSMLKKK